jgi:hypothetical protein
MAATIRDVQIRVICTSTSFVGQGDLMSPHAAMRKIFPADPSAQIWLICVRPSPSLPVEPALRHA